MIRAFTQQDQDEADNYSTSYKSPFKKIQEARNLDKEFFNFRIEEEEDKDFCIFFNLHFQN
jgi:hypothetical protein